MSDFENAMLKIGIRLGRAPWVGIVHQALERAFEAGRGEICRVAEIAAPKDTPVLNHADILAATIVAQSELRK